MAERKLLVIDDDRMIHTVLRAGLEKHGYKIHSAFDPIQAQMMVRQVRPDLMVLDITMPGGGGFEAFKRMQMLSTTSQIPILVYTSVPPEEVAKKIPLTPTVAVLRKPATPEAILAEIQKLLP
jgi:CheY-like chemotaxis protein